MMISRRQFLDGLQSAVKNRTGYATAKLGISEIQRLNYSVIAARTGPDSRLLRTLKPYLVYYSLKQAAIFPPDPLFYLKFNEFYAEHLRNLDCLGIFPELLERSRTVIDHYQLEMPLVSYLDQEPDRSSPSQEENCYLPYFQGKKLLLVCSFAALLKERANQQTFEGVWAKTRKRWFDPLSVDALEFPFGYTAETHRHYDSSLQIFEEIAAEMSRRDFDVALIAAAGLGIPIASYAKRLGKMGIHLGGHLQVLFGILGQRWRSREDWRERYFNDWWVDMPARYRPPEKDIADNGAYW
jgi:hypothetical protein